MLITIIALAFSPTAHALARKPASKPSAILLLQKADELRGPNGEVSYTVRVKDFENKAERRETTYKVWAKGNPFAKIETTAPTRLQGRKVLMRNNDLWLYLPSVKRATRISLQQRLTGEVSNGDLARSNLFEDYVPKSIKSQKMGNLPCYVLDLKAKSKIATYRRIQLWIQQSDSRPVRADFYALSGKILKSSEYSEFEEVLGLPRATKVVIRDALDPKRESHLKYSDFKRESLDESFFSKDGLQ